MSTRDDLEASLRARPDDATLAVYADLLQAQGDPRGELISLDLHPPEMSTHGIETRRGQLLAKWLGDDIDLEFDHDQQLWYAGSLDATYATFDCGFVELVARQDPDGEAPDDVLVARLLAGTSGDYLRRLAIEGPTAMLDGILDGLTARERPWLQQLSLVRPAWETPKLSIAKLAAATPHLEVLELAGRKMLDRFTHANLRALSVTGGEAIDLIDGPPLPSLTEIEFGFEGEVPAPVGLFSPDRVPSLRRLDFSREEPGTRMFRELGVLRVAAQITHVKLPSIRSMLDRDLVQAGVDRMERLRELVIAREYLWCGRVASGLRHAHAHIRLAPSWPWPPADTHGDFAILIDGFATGIYALTSLLEAQYDELADDIKSIWYRFWMQLGDNANEHAFNAGDLVQALQAMTLDDHLTQLSDRLRTRIAQRGAYYATIQRDY